MTPRPFILGNQWPTPKARFNGTQEREQCGKCGRWCVVSGIGRHKAKCLGVLKAEPIGHENRICGLNGCERICRLNERCCYLCAGPEGRMDELDRANGWGRYKAKAVDECEAGK